MTTPQTISRTLPGTFFSSIADLVNQHLAALALRDDDYPLSPMASTLVLVIHLVGLAAFWRYYHQPIWLAVPTLAFLLALPLLKWWLETAVTPTASRPAPTQSQPTDRQRSWRVGFALGLPRPSVALHIEALAPLFFLYAILIARVIAVRVLLANEPYQDEASFADPRFIFFQVEATTAAVIGYLALVQTVRLTRGAIRTRVLVLLSAALGIAALGWFAAETLGHRTRGVTATDPYAYAQMAVDLATRGTPLHSFSLFPYVVNLNVSWYPIEHIGYRLFDNLSGSVPTVWPIGGSVLLALFYRLLGEEGLYIATPLVSLAALVAFAFLAWECATHLAGASHIPTRAAITAISVALLATSWEQVDRSIVPLVDTQAQLFSVLAVLFALKATRRLVGGLNTENCLLFTVHARSTERSSLFTGFSLGAAYFVRHTQLLMAIPIVVAVWPLPWRERLRFLIIAAVAALVVALPDLWYHQQHFGNWLTPESHELALFSWSSLLPSAESLSQRFLAGNEFGYLIPFLLYGIFRAARDDAHKFAVLAVWVLVLGGFHLLYAAVKIRDLLPEFPAVILLTGYGIVALARDVRAWATPRPHPPTPFPLSWAELQAQERGKGARGLGVRVGVVALAIFVALLLPAMRNRLTILRPFQPPKVTFGYVTQAQRAAFDQIAALTPPNAVIGSTMNDGAIDLYAQRATFRPGVWNADERALFIAIMQRENRPIYLLDDGAETSAARRDLSTRYSLRRIAVLDVPLFGEIDDTPGALWEIVW